MRPRTVRLRKDVCEYESRIGKEHKERNMERRQKNRLQRKKNRLQRHIEMDEIEIGRGNRRWINGRWTGISGK